MTYGGTLNSPGFSGVESWSWRRKFVSSGEPTRFALLAGGGRAALPRLQTLRTTIDWSYDLLTAGEQILLRRLCAFAGRFTLDDVESVCTSGDRPVTEVFAMGSSLFDKSLVIREDFREWM